MDKTLYPIYMGWYFPTEPPLFYHPSEAITWGISRFAKDGLANIWGQGSYPDFMRYLGVVKISSAFLRSTAIPSHGERESKIEKRFFSDVEFLSIQDLNKVKSSSYTKSTDLLFLSCLVLFKDALPNYFMSLGSIYRANVKCHPISGDVTSFVHSPQISNLLKNMKTYPFIRVESRFCYLKENNYCNPGEKLPHLHLY